MKYQEKITDWVQLYLKHIRHISIETHVVQEEGYKFQAVQHFQTHFNIEEADLAGNLELALLNNNLVTGAQYFPRGTLLAYARILPEETRSILRLLFDESKAVSKRITETRTAFERLNEMRNKQVERPFANTYMGLRFLSLLLSFRFPEKYNALKPVEWKVFSRFLNPTFSIPNHTPFGEQYEMYAEYIEPLRQYLMTRDEISIIKNKLVEGLAFHDDAYRWMTQDVIYVTARVFAGTRAQEIVRPDIKELEPKQEEVEVGSTEPTEDGTGFMPFEEHLEEYVVKNWENIDFGEELTLYKDEDGTPGQQYTTDVGIIDILAKDAHDNYVVIELKRAEAGYKVVGQILNYMGWVQDKLSHKEQKVRGLIIVGKADKTLQSALKLVSDKVGLREYRISIKLNFPSANIAETD
jgi:hypothetical protein